jgi:dihydroxy-acid dehydratase
MRTRSSVVFDGPERAFARAYMKGIGFDDDDLSRPTVGIANTWIEAMPCNFHLRGLAEHVKEGVRAAGGTPLEFNTIAISDGITMGTQGTKTSLVSREVIADSIELTARGYQFDAVIALSGCDKTIPGCVMALARLDVPSLMLYGGSILPGRWRGKDVTIQDVFEAIGKHTTGEMSDDDLYELEGCASPGAGACGAQFTANTMASAFEVMGISPMGTSMVPAVAGAREQVARECGELAMRVLADDLRPSQVITKDSLENAIATVCMSGGSTNGVLHLLAVASEAGIELTIDDFDRISERTPLLGDLKPGGRFVAKDLYEAGGVGVLAKRLDEAGVLHREAITVTGRTIGEEADASQETPAGGGSPSLGSALADRRTGHSARQPRPGGLRGQGRGRGAQEAHGPGAGLRLRGGVLRSGRAAGNQARRRRCDPQRGPVGRARHAGDAPGDGRAGGRGNRRPGRVAHGRTLLRRHPRPDGGSRRPGGNPRRSDRGRPGRR